MKPLFRTTSALLLALTLFVASCQKDEPDDPRDSLVGSWTCAETGQVHGKQTFTIRINKSGTDNSSLTISNFSNLGTNTSVTASLSGSSISIPNQTVTDFDISGNGNASGNSNISLKYVMDDKQIKDDLTATCTKL